MDIQAICARPRRWGKIIGQYPSIANDRSMAYRTPVSLDLLILLDQACATGVATMDERIGVIKYASGDKAWRYKPDLVVSTAFRAVAVECTWERYATRSAETERYAVLQVEYARQGWEYRVVTDKQVRAGTYLQNVRELAQDARYPVSPALRGRVYGILAAACAPCTISALAAQLTASGVAHRAVIRAILSLLYHKALAAPLHLGRIDGDTPVCLPFQLRKAYPNHPIVDQLIGRTESECIVPTISRRHNLWQPNA